MNLNRAAREYYALAIVTDPPVAAWEATFDNGATWDAGATTDGVTRWLVAAPDAVAGSAVAVLPLGTTKPRVRATSNPEVIVRDAPAIYVS